MSIAPSFSVVMATYNRGRHILPSVRSVLQQDYQDFELIVVGDQCIDETEQVLRPYLSERVRWLNLPERWKAQSGPNNAGIENSVGQYIAYIGHDDLWAADHLSRLVGVLQGERDLDFVVSGTVFYAPPGVDRHHVTGFITSSDDVSKHFFPPSSVAHRRDVIDRIGLWKRPEEIRAPVDADFQLRAAAAGMLFKSTGAITVHKFAAGHRYLSYLGHQSDEQEAMLVQMLDRESFANKVDSIVVDSKRAGLFMPRWLADARYPEPGLLARQNSAGKGVHLPPARPVGNGLVLPHWPRQNYAFDWQEQIEGQIRWVGLNPNPKLLINYVSSQRALFALAIVHSSADALRQIELTIESGGEPNLGEATAMADDLFVAPVTIVLEATSFENRVAKFHLVGDQIATPERRGIGILPALVLPIPT